MAQDLQGIEEKMLEHDNNRDHLEGKLDSILHKLEANGSSSPKRHRCDSAGTVDSFGNDSDANPSNNSSSGVL